MPGPSPQASGHVFAKYLRYIICFDIYQQSKDSAPIAVNEQIIYLYVVHCRSICFLSQNDSNGTKVNLNQRGWVSLRPITY